MRLARGTAPSSPRSRARSSRAARHAAKPATSKRPSSLRNAIRLSEARLQAVSSRNMYSEHGLEALIRPEFGQVCHSLMVVSYWMPGSALRPGGVRDLIPELARRQRLRDLAVGAPDQLPLAVLEHALQELAGDPHRVVRVLAGDREVGVRSPSRSSRSGSRSGCSPGGRTGSPAGARSRAAAPRARCADRLLELGVRPWGSKRASPSRPPAWQAVKDRVQVPREQLRARDQRRDLLLLDHLPADELLDVRMVDVDHDHLGGAPRGAAGLDGARRRGRRS